jgi:signal transduction histidine kinase
VPTDELKDQIEELVMMQRVDQELGATLDFDSVLMLTMDWALRRTGAAAGMYSTLILDGTALIPLIALGYPPDSIPYHADKPWPLTLGVVGRAARTRQPQFVRDVQQDSDYLSLIPSTRSEIAVPIEIRGNLLGVISLESDKIDTFDEADVAFVRRLAGRAAIALDHARLYREAEAQADEMASLYAASRLISSSLERVDAVANAAQSFATVLRVSSVIIAEYNASHSNLAVAAAYRLPTVRNAPDVLPAVGDTIDLDSLPEMSTAIQRQHPLFLSTEDSNCSAALRTFMEARHFRTMLIAPLTVPLTAQTTYGEVMGIALAVESRRTRKFTGDEIQMAEAIASQVASAMRQARLYENVRELENLKSEMIRMASHDLRNPLGNVMGYFDLLLMTLSKTCALLPEQQEYTGHIRRSLNTMKSLIEDLLTLERVESERQVSWTDLDFGAMVADAVEAQQSAAQLKNHALSLVTENDTLYVFGSSTQLRQAVANLISNAIKYTPEHGQIQVRLSQKEKRLIFEVQDNGYGISKERQQRLFHRFYRAHEPGTDHIPGTGLGLSLVKTVIERHGGEVWVHSEPGIGSTFGFWLPLSTALHPPVSEEKTA